MERVSENRVGGASMAENMTVRFNFFCQKKMLTNRMSQMPLMKITFIAYFRCVINENDTSISVCPI